VSFPALSRRWSVVPLALIAGLIVMPAITAHAATPLDVPVTVADWAMDDGQDGVMHDASAYGNDGSLQNVGTGSGYYDFTVRSGHPSRVVVPDSSSLNPGSSIFTVTMHVQLTARPKFDTDYDLIRKGQGDAAADWKIEIMDTGKARCYAKGSKGHGELFSSSALSIGVWHTIVCTYSPSSMKVSVDGRGRTLKRNFGSISNTAALSIAAKYGPPDDSGDQYAGKMIDVTITSQ
jgi:hypothetical protein